MLLACAPGLTACVGYRTDLLEAGAGEAGRAAADTAAPRDGRDGRDLARSEQRPLWDCTLGEPYVLALGSDDYFYRLDLDTLALTALAPVWCLSDGLNSMTVSPLGAAYISSQRGKLCAVDLHTFTATATTFDPIDVGRSPFGMALLPDDTPAGQSLYIAVHDSGTSDRLSRIDLGTFELSEIGPITPAIPRTELTAGPNGKLYGLAVEIGGSLLLTIDPETGSAVLVTGVPAGGESVVFGLVYWQDALYLFVGPGSPWDVPGYGSSEKAAVFRYRTGDAQVDYVGSLPIGIIGAGVAVCQ